MLGELLGQHGAGKSQALTTRMNQTTVAERSRTTTNFKGVKNGKPQDLNSVQESVRALWEATDDTDPDARTLR